MTLRRFCDVCDAPIIGAHNVADDRLTHLDALGHVYGGVGIKLPDAVNAHVGIVFEIHAGTRGQLDKGDLCRACLLAAIDLLRQDGG